MNERQKRFAKRFPLLHKLAKEKVAKSLKIALQEIEEEMQAKIDEMNKFVRKFCDDSDNREPLTMKSIEEGLEIL